MAVTCGRVRSATRLVAGLAVAWLASTPATASPTLDLHEAATSVPRPSVGATVTAGERVRLEWPSLPPDVDEFEILLSLDGGASYPIRLTPQLAPGTTVLTWEIPNLPTMAARVRLRAGFDGHEIEGAPSRAFRLLAREDLPPAPLRYADGEWWISVGASLWSLALTRRTEPTAQASKPAVEELGALAPSNPPLAPPPGTIAQPAVHPRVAAPAVCPVAPQGASQARPQRE